MTEGSRSTLGVPGSADQATRSPAARAEDAADRRTRRLSYGVIATIVVLATFVLWLWGRSPYGRYLGHEGVGEGDSGVVAFTLFVLGWTLMTVAMMLPSALPLVRAFGRLTRRRAHHRGLHVVMIGAFLALWALFGVAALRADQLVHAVVERIGWLAERPQVIVGAVLLSAGAYQLSSLRYRCLSRCQSPAGFVIRHWNGDRPYRTAASIGGAYGFYCLACCWALMMLMFAVGTANVALMLGLGAVMAVEKNLPRARALVAPLGPLLITVGGGLTIVGIIG